MSDITIGVFANRDEARQAIDELVAAGVSEGDLHPIRRQRIEESNIGTVGALTRAIGFGTGAVSNELTRFGVDQQAAAFYEDELGEDSLLLAVETTDENEDQVTSIMRRANATLHQP